MSKFKVGDTAVGCYERAGRREPIYSIVSKVFQDGMIDVMWEDPYGIDDRSTIHENQVCSFAQCPSCAHRLTRLVTGGYCPASYSPIS